MQTGMNDDIKNSLYELRQYDAETIVALYHIAISVHTLFNDQVLSTIPFIFFNVLFLVSITKKSYLFKKFLALCNVVILSGIFFEYYFGHKGHTDTNIDGIWISIVVMFYFVLKKRNGECKR